MLQTKRFTVNFVQVNTYLLWDESKKACLIDPGFSNPMECQELIDFLDQEGLTLVRCIATHLHFDHIMGGKFIKDHFGIAMEAPVIEMTELPSLSSQLKAFGMPFTTEYDFAYQPLDANNVESIEFGHTSLRILETPGHSPGHYSYYNPSGEGVVFCGDVLFCNGMGRYDLWGGSYEVLMNSIQKVLFELPDSTRVLSGHGPETTIEREKHNFV